MFLSEGDDYTSISRSTKLITTFEPYWRPEANKSFAIYWAMAVGPWYRDQLDIELTDRVVKKRKQRTWTQGPCFCFSAGNVIYDSPIAHTTKYWRDAIPYINIAVNVTAGVPNEITALPDGGKKFKEGFVNFELLRPDKINGFRTSKLVTESTHHLSQNDFVRGIMNGMETVL